MRRWKEDSAGRGIEDEGRVHDRYEGGLFGDVKGLLYMEGNGGWKQSI